MKKDRNANLKFTTFICLLTLLGSLTDAQAFCVKNETDVTITAHQTTNHKILRGFTEDIFPDSKSCCSWENDTCNKEGKKESPTMFHIFYAETVAGPPFFGPSSPKTVTICNAYTIPANGTLVVSGKKGSYWCEER